MANQPKVMKQMMTKTTIQLNDLIQIYDDVLEPELCQLLIQAFEDNSDSHEIIDTDKKPSFTQLNLTQLTESSERLRVIQNLILSKVFQYRTEYYEFISDKVFPTENSFEYFRIKKYNNNGNDLFDTHVDVMDHGSAKRFLSFLFYLNDVELGGETLFEGLTIQPKCGRLIMFPPLWMFPHKGCVPVSNEKYILTTYLHYK
jgi:prolyl 4-hydroxylase